jgi:hypothetical protein
MIEALSLIEPWATLIVVAGKNPENRKWSTKKRGWFLIHTSQQMPQDEYDGAVEFARAAGYQGPLPAPAEIRKGVIMGAAKITGCMSYADQKRAGHDMRWSMQGQYGFFLSDVIALPPVPARGMPSFWKVPRQVREGILAECGRLGQGLPGDLAALLLSNDEPEPPKKQIGLFDE